MGVPLIKSELDLNEYILNCHRLVHSGGTVCINFLFWNGDIEFPCVGIDTHNVFTDVHKQPAVAVFTVGKGWLEQQYWDFNGTITTFENIMLYYTIFVIVNLLMEWDDDDVVSQNIMSWQTFHLKYFLNN